MSIFTVSDLIQILEPLSLVRRKAVLYGLETKARPEQMLSLSWRGALNRANTELGKNVIRSLPRHLKLNYAFWEYLPGGLGVPLFGLERDLFNRTGYLYSALQGAYEAMLWADPQADAVMFREAIVDILGDPQ